MKFPQKMQGIRRHSVGVASCERFNELPVRLSGGKVAAEHQLYLLRAVSDSTQADNAMLGEEVLLVGIGWNCDSGGLIPATKCGRLGAGRKSPAE